MKNSFISLDVECTSLRFGFKIYAIAMIVYRKGVETARFCGARLVTKDDLLFARGSYWQTDMTASHTVSNAVQYDDELKMFRDAADFFKFHASRRDDGTVSEMWGNINYNETPVIFHGGMVAEGELFRKFKELGFLGELEAPICPIEVADLLRAKGRNPMSVDSYIREEGLIVSKEGETHNPLFDCEQAATAYFNLIK